MKRLLALFLTLFLFMGITFAQFTSGSNASIRADNSEMVISFAGTVDSLGGSDSLLTSAVFDIEDYDGATSNFTVYYLLTSAGALTPSVTGILYASEDNSTYTATTDTLINTATGETPVWSAFTIQGGARAAYYKLRLFSNSGGSDATFAIKIRCPLKETRPGTR